MGTTESTRHITWHQQSLFDSPLIECNVRVTMHGPSGSALIGLWSRDGDPGSLVLQELHTGVPIAEVEAAVLQLVRELVGHELNRLQPF